MASDKKVDASGRGGNTEAEFGKQRRGFILGNCASEGKTGRGESVGSMLLAQRFGHILQHLFMTTSPSVLGLLI